MARIKLKFPATCKDCGAYLEVGSTARYYGRGRVYGTTCHPQKLKSTWIDRYYGNNLDDADISERDMNQMLGVGRW